MSGKMLLPVGDVPPSRWFFEQSFNAPFPTINSALYYALTIGMAQLGTLPSHDDSTGVTRYVLRFPAGDIMYIFVLQRADSITTIRMHPAAPPGAEPTVHPETRMQLGELLAECVLEARDAMRYTHPDVGVRPVEGISEPMPLYSVKGWEAVFTWWATWATAMSPEELAERQNVSVQTIYNKSSKLGLQRTRRGKKSQRKNRVESQ
jgi:hypothetical protein